MAAVLDIQLAQAARDAGLHGEPLVISVAVALAETRGVPTTDAHNDVYPDDSWGPWQINRLAHPQFTVALLTTLVGNAQAMVVVSKGGTDWTPWSTYNDQLWKDYKSRAVTAVTALGDTGYAPPGGIGALLPGPQPVFTPPPTASLIPALTVYGPSQLELNGERLNGTAEVLDATLYLDLHEASRLVVKVVDTTRQLLRSDLAAKRSRITLDSVWFDLADVSKSGDHLDLTFIDAAASDYLRIIGEDHTQAPLTGTRGDFLRRLAGRVPWVQCDIETGSVTQVELRSEPGESLWETMGRVARDIEWTRLALANRLLIGSEEWLGSRTAPVEIAEFTAGVESVDFDYVLGVKVDRAQFTVDTGLWWVPPTQQVALSGLGVADGNWLVSAIERQLSSTRAAVKLSRATTPLPEPVQEVLHDATTGPSQVPLPPGMPGGASIGASKCSPDFVTEAVRGGQGKPYKYGAEASPSDPNPPRFDCSELVEWALARVGITIPDGSGNQVLHCSRGATLIPVADGIRTYGALLFRTPDFQPGHVAISRGDGTTIEARGTAWGCGVFSATEDRSWTHAALVPGVTYG